MRVESEDVRGAARLCAGGLQVAGGNNVKERGHLFTGVQKPIRGIRGSLRRELRAKCKTGRARSIEGSEGDF